ncbi:MAG: 2-succinylbenzoate--CoA ligase [Snowella sp.]|nr:2-succinylbenzoate--CoA ligase [Snowella sp.]
MVNFISHLKTWTYQNQFIGYDNDDFYQLVEIYCQKLQKTNATYQKIILAERDRYQFLAAFLACLMTQKTIFLANPDWQEWEWKHVIDGVKPDLILGSAQNYANIDSSKSEEPLSQLSDNTNTSFIMIPTGGSSGKIKFTIHTWETLTASVNGFKHYFEVQEINSFCLLPLYHVSGLMQFIRSFVSLGKFVILPYTSFKENPNLPFEYQDFFISLVPKQLQFFLKKNPEGLAQFKTVLLGGAPAWPELLQQARASKIKLAPTYGMTETASQIVTLKSDDFLAGNNSVGRVLPHAQVMICNAQGQELGIHQTGIITIQSQSLFLGYYPNFQQAEVFETDDLGYFDSAGFLHLVGRNSQKIITGGENVFPSEVEAVILASNLITDVVVIGLPDPDWGEIVTAIYVSKNDNFNLSSLQMILRSQLSAYKCPKRWIKVQEIPRSPSGKINYQWLKTYAQSPFKN